MQIYRPRTDRASSRSRNSRAPRPRQQRAEHDERRAHRLDQLVRRLVRGDVGRTQLDAMIVGPSRLDPEPNQELHRSFHIAQARNVTQLERLRRQQRRHHDRQRRVLAAAQRDGAAQRSTAVNYHFFHLQLPTRFARTHDARMSREIVYHSDHAASPLPRRVLRPPAPAPRQFRRSARHRSRDAAARPPAILRRMSQTIHARAQSDPRFVVAHIGLQSGDLRIIQVRRVRDYHVERSERALLRPEYRSSRRAGASRDPRLDAVGRCAMPPRTRRRKYRAP